jgi:hypothetical protein
MAGVVCQGTDWKNAKVAAFFSAKLNAAQQNYPVHEIEMLAGIEAMLRHRGILQGCPFTWMTDHKGLIHLMNQKNLSGCQARWIEKTSNFEFEVRYVPGTESVLADTLSRIYSHESPGTVCAWSEYTYHDVIDNDMLNIGSISMPVFAGCEATALTSDRVTRSMTCVASGVTEQPRPPSKVRFADQQFFGSLGDPKEGGGTQKKNSPAKTQTTELKPKKTAKRAASPAPQPVEPQVPNVESSTAPLRDDAVPSELDSELESMDESLLEVVNSGWIGLDIPKLITNRYGEDPFFKHILDEPKMYRNFEVKDGLIYLKRSDRRVLCIPRIEYKERSLRELIISDAHSILAHLGLRKTLDYLRDYVWWKEIVDDTRSFCETCVTCMHSKPSNKRPYGLLYSLNPPTQPWEAIGVDFVGPLPESKNRDGVFNSLTCRN